MRLVRWSNLLFLAALIWLMEKWVTVPILDQAAFGEQLPGYILLLIMLATVFIAAGGYVINDYFDVKIEYVELTQEEFNAKMAEFKSELQSLFDESNALQAEIMKQLGKVKYE